MKPDSIRKFDWLYLGSVAVGLLALFVGWDVIKVAAAAEMAAAGGAQMGEGFTTGAIIFGAVFGIAINVALWFLISVLRIELVKWLLILLALYNIVTIPSGIAAVGGIAPIHIPAIVSTIMAIAAIWFLFRPDAKAWFAEKKGASDSE